MRDINLEIMLSGKQFIKSVILSTLGIPLIDSPSKNDFVAHIFATVWAICWQDIGRTAHISAVYDMGNMWLRRLSRILATLFPISCPHSCHICFSQSVCHIISIMWENYGPYSAEAPKPHMAHILPIHYHQIFFYAGLYLTFFFTFCNKTLFFNNSIFVLFY